jgi:serine/threonine protein kinase
MPEFIQEHPNIRYKTIKTLLRTNLRAKTVVTRRGTPDDKTFIMVTAPNTTEDGSPNGVKDAVSKLLKLDHPNLVSVYEAYENEGYYYWIIRDWSLKMKASKRFGVSSLTEGQVAETMQDLAAAMLYMHKNGVEHGSLCFEDIQFTRKFDDTSDVLNVKIIDLGVGRHVDEKRYVKARQERRYGEPPELKDGKFSAKSDVWTLGSTAFRLLTGAISDEHNAELTKGGSSKELRDKTESISDEGTDFIERCLRENPEDRMAMEEAVNHTWFSCADRESAPLSSDVMDALNQEDIRGAFMRRACPVSYFPPLSVHRVVSSILLCLGPALVACLFS